MINLRKDNKKMDKGGYYRFADIGMFVISFAIIAVGIGIGIFAFYSHQVDVRENEAKILSDRLVRTIMEDGKLMEGVLGEEFNILEEAGLSEIVDNGDFYFKLEIFFGDALARTPFIEGNRGFEVDCFLPGENLPKPHQENFILGNYRIKILTCSNQQGERL